MSLCPVYSSGVAKVAADLSKQINIVDAATQASQTLAMLARVNPDRPAFVPPFRHAPRFRRAQRVVIVTRIRLAS